MRPVTVTCGGLAASSATKISLSQSVPDGTAIVIDGAASSGYSATSIATTTGNGASTTTVTLNGSLVSGGVAYLATPSQVVLVSAGNDSGKTWTVTGILSDGITSKIETVAAANASRVATKSVFGKVSSIKLSSGSAGNVSAGTNGIATLDKPREVLFTSGGTDTGITFTITGTDWAGLSQSETVTGGSSGSPVATILDYLKVTSIVASGATASTLTVGTNGVSGAYWVLLDQWASKGCGIQITVSGTVNYTIQSSFDNPNAPSQLSASQVTWQNSQDSNVVGQIASAQTAYTYTPLFVRCLINSGTGTATVTVTQAMNAPF